MYSFLDSLGPRTHLVTDSDKGGKFWPSSASPVGVQIENLVIFALS